MKFSIGIKFDFCLEIVGLIYIYRLFIIDGGYLVDLFVLFYFCVYFFGRVVVDVL